ncbi:MAG TPA: GNAT family N-acetyltransferase [Acidimicrobiia bacterium]|nr:GNAT family N-acetyltransferase [Acidimicrobiia bacterium]
MAMVSQMEILPLTLDRLPDLSLLFGQGGDPKWCWCASFRMRSADFRKSNPDANRRVLELALKATSLDDRAPGLIAYRDSDPIGWVSFGPRDDFVRLSQSRLLAPVDEDEVWSIVCFVVSKRARGDGVANALLEAAVGYARSHGAARLEAYPVETEGNRIPSANVYMGTLGMFERAGFEVVERRRATRTSVTRAIVRRTL